MFFSTISSMKRVVVLSNGPSYWMTGIVVLFQKLVSRERLWEVTGCIIEEGGKGRCCKSTLGEMVGGNCVNN